MNVTSYQQVLPKYDFDEITEFRLNGKTWRQISDYYGVKHPAVMNWYKREKLRRAQLQSGPERVLGKRIKQNFQDTGHVSRLRNNSSAPPPNTPGRHKLSPTNYISPLSNDEWIVKYCGRGYDWELDYLTEMRDFLWDNHRGLCLEPRGHGKTQSIIALFVRHILEKRTPILNINAGSGNSRRIFKEVKRFLESEQIRLDYGDVIESANKTTMEIVLKPELSTGSPDPNLKCVGRGGEVIGLHPAWIHLEDIIQEEFKNDESNDDLITWYNEVVNYLAVEDTKITVTGTRKSLADFYSWICHTHDAICPPGLC